MSAIISPDGKYRYRLERMTEKPIAGYPLAVIMVNPSTADADVDDATIRRLRGFADRLGHPRLIVGNLFALRATDVKELGRSEDPVGPSNDDHIARILAAAVYGRVVVGWGSTAKIPQQHRSRVADFARFAERNGVPLWCWGINADGSPKHPLYLPNDATLIPWEYHA